MKNLIRFLLLTGALLYPLVQIEATRSWDLRWNKPRITTDTHITFLTEMPSCEITAPESKQRTYFTFSSWKNFRRAFHDFFTVDDKTALLQYNPGNQEEEYNFFQVRFLSGFDYVFHNRDDDYYFLYNGLEVAGVIRERIFLLGEWWAGHFNIKDPETLSSAPYLDSWYQQAENKDRTYLDNLAGIIAYRNEYMTLTLGRGSHQIGSNIAGSIILDDASNDFGYFSARINLGSISLALLQGNLIPDSLSADPSVKYNDKYLVSHKIDWQPNDFLHFFLGEHVVYGNRNLDPSYLLPHVFLRITEHNLHDRDNVFIFTGGELVINQDNIIYLNFILDELSKAKLFSSWWGNKYALQVGFSRYLGHNRFLRLVLEGIAIRPWLYTHNILENKFSHDGISLGFPYGTNLLGIFSELNLRMHDRIHLDLNSGYFRQGSVGNQFYLNYSSRPSDRASWLEGEITNSVVLRGTVTWQPLAHFRLKTGVFYMNSDNQDDTIDLFCGYQVRF
ncbi:MAG: hypothetical protein JXB60_09365 [Candidatus Cloacimonetes bacterium]|nr:hypothetical protein [Candidatus Cloacimonadota bacterium]